MLTINIHQAKTNLSKLIEEVSTGKEIIIAKAGKPAAKLVPIAATRPKRKPGALKGKIKITEDFDATLPDDILHLFEKN